MKAEPALKEVEETYKRFSKINSKRIFQLDPISSLTIRIRFKLPNQTFQMVILHRITVPRFQRRSV